jgi:hypothetical protein
MEQQLSNSVKLLNELNPSLVKKICISISNRNPMALDLNQLDKAKKGGPKSDRSGKSGVSRSSFKSKN